MFMDMPSRKVLKSVAQGMLDSFTSRNNDAGGYWAVGQLLQQALTHKQTAYHFDLLNDSASQVFGQRPLQIVPLRYRALFWQQLTDRQWLKQHVAKAYCSIEFDLTNDKLSPERPDLVTYGFECSVKITDDYGQTHERKISSWCWPHNPRYESKSNREYGLD